MIYKICTAAEWHEATADGVYHGSTDDKRDGFIHFSTASQLRGTLDKHFSGLKNLCLIAVHSGDLGDQLKWEPSRAGQLFPHLYAPLPVTAAQWTVPVALDSGGDHIIPDVVSYDESASQTDAMDQR